MIRDSDKVATPNRTQAYVNYHYYYYYYLVLM